MSNRKYLSKMTGILLAGMLLCAGMTVLAAPSVRGDTELTVTADETVSAEYTITNDEAMESVSLTLSYDKDALTYMSGSGGDNFSGNGGNGSVTLQSRPQSETASFSVRFKSKEEGSTEVKILSCTAVVDGTEVDLLSGGAVSGGEDEEDEEHEDEGKRASFVIDERTFYLHSPESLEDFDAVHMDIQGIDSRVLKHVSLDVYVIRLYSDNGSYRDNFVYDPEKGTVIPFVQMRSGNDTVIFLEPDEDVHIPVRYSRVDMGWGPKYTIPALHHVIIDGVDEIPDDTDHYLVYGINQDGEKAWYCYDYDKDSLQLFDDVAYQGEQNYILELEEKELGLRADGYEQVERYNRDMGRRLYIILFLVIFIVVLLNLVVLMYLRMRKMQMLDPEDEEDIEDGKKSSPGAFVTGNLEENETDFQEPEEEPEEEDEEERDIDLEIIDLDDLEDDD